MGKSKGLSRHLAWKFWSDSMQTPVSAEHQRIPNACVGVSPRPIRICKQQLVQKDAQQSPDSSRGEQNDSKKPNGIPPEREPAEYYLCCCLVNVQTTGKALFTHVIVETLSLCHSLYAVLPAPRKLRDPQLCTGTLPARPGCSNLVQVCLEDFWG